MTDARTVGAKLWLTAAFLGGALVVVVALGTAGLAVWQHVEHVEATEKAHGLARAMNLKPEGSTTERVLSEDPFSDFEVVHQGAATYHALGFSEWESRGTDAENLSSMRTTAERRRAERNTALIAAPLILLLGLALVFGLYRWGRWLVR